MEAKTKRNAWISDNAIWIVLVVLILLASLATSGKFFTLDNAVTLLTGESVRGVMTCGVAFVILSKGIDLSPGAVAALAGVVGAACCQMDSSTKLWGGVGTMPAIVGILIALAIGAAVGLANGAMVAYLHLHPFIATLGTQLICRALSKIISNKPVSNLSDSYRFLGREHFGPFYMIIIVFAVIAVILGFMLNFTRFGKSIYAIGGNDQAARVAGVNVEHSLIKVYIWGSVCAALAGILLGGRSGSIDPSTTGLNYELDAIAAATIGGTSQTGGICKIGGVICGVLIMGVINNGLVMMGVDDNVTNIIKGLIIIGSVAFDMRKNRVKV